jgi:hypothetical protein
VAAVWGQNASTSPPACSAEGALTVGQLSVERGDCQLSGQGDEGEGGQADRAPCAMAHPDAVDRRLEVLERRQALIVDQIARLPEQIARAIRHSSSSSSSSRP